MITLVRATLRDNSLGALRGGLMRVMISSTVLDLPQHRAAAIDSIQRMSLQPEVMEHLPPGAGNAYDRSMRLVDRADLYVCILAHRYGTVDRDRGRSYTHLELLRAKERRLPVLALVSQDEGIPDPQGPAAELRTWTHRTFGSDGFRSVDDLRAKLVVGLYDVIARSGWDRLSAGHTVVPSPPRPYAVHPYTLIGDALVGRSQALDDLSSWFRSPGGAPLLQVEALGGVGKTSLLWHWFNRDDPDRAGSFWWSFYEGDLGLDRMTSRALAYITQRSIGAVESMDATDREEELLAHLDQDRHLLVLDGLERATRAYATNDEAFVTDAEVAGAPRAMWGAGGVTLSSAELRQTQSLRLVADPRLGAFLRRLTRVGAGRTIVSSRNPCFDLETASGLPLPGVTSLRLPGLDDSSAASLWSGVCGQPPSDEVREVLRATDNHPLFIRALAAEVRDHRPAPGDFERWRMARPGFDPINLLGADPRKRHVLQFALGGLTDEQTKVLGAIASAPGPVAFETLAAELVPGYGPYAHLFAAAQPDFAALVELDDALRLLGDRGLIGWDRVANRFDMHPLVRGVATVLTGQVRDPSLRHDQRYRRLADVGVTIITPPRDGGIPAVPLDGLLRSVTMPIYLGWPAGESTIGAPDESWGEVVRARWDRNLPGIPWSPGVGFDGPIWLDMTASPHVLVGGASGSGKTQLLCAIGATLAMSQPPERLRLLLVDHRGGGAFGALEHLPHTLALVSDDDDLDELASGLRAELEARERTIMREKGSAAIVVLVDEIASLARVSPQIIDVLTAVAVRGAAVRMHLVLGTQRHDLVGGELRLALGLRIAMRMYSQPEDTRALLGVPALPELDRDLPGRGYIRTVDGEALLFQGLYPGAGWERKRGSDLERLVRHLNDLVAHS